MTTMQSRSDRRAWIKQLLASGALGAAGLTGLIRRAHAAARRPYPEGVQDMKGDVRINNAPAKPGSIVKVGDTVTTGADSMVVFVVGQDAFLLRDHTRVQIKGEPVSDKAKTAVIKALTVLTGKVLSVFGGGEKRIVSPTVTIGIRGTGVYIEVEPKRTYVCTCYGETVLQAKDSKVSETINTRHHESPRYVYAGKAPQPITTAPVVNHTDDELTMLEALLGRSPPFAGSSDHRY